MSFATQMMAAMNEEEDSATEAAPRVTDSHRHLHVQVRANMHVYTGSSLSMYCNGFVCSMHSGQVAIVSRQSI